MTILADLDRARRLTFAADEVAAKELLLALGEQIEERDRDDLLMEVYSQLGEIYLVRTAYDGVEEALRRIRDCLAVYSSILAGTNPEAAAQVTLSEAEINQTVCRYSRRAQFLQTGLAAAYGDHDAAEIALLDLVDDDGSTAAHPDLKCEHEFLITYARILCATALCDDDDQGRAARTGSRWRRIASPRDPRGPGPDRRRGAQPVRVRSTGHFAALGSGRPKLA